MKRQAKVKKLTATGLVTEATSVIACEQWASRKSCKQYQWLKS